MRFWIRFLATLCYVAGAGGLLALSSEPGHGLLLLLGLAAWTAQRGGNLLHEAARRDERFLAEMLLERGERLEARNGAGETPMDVAVVSGAREMIRFCLSRGIRLNAPSPNGYTPLYLAIITGGSLPLVEFLLDLGADPDQPCSGWRPLQLARHLRRDDLVQLLLARGAPDR